MPYSRTTIFVSLNIRVFLILNLCLKLIADPIYCSIQLEHVTKQIILQLLHDKLPFIRYLLTVFVHLKLLPVIKMLFHMSHLLQLTIIQLVLILGLGCKEGATISFRSLLCL